jgi:Mg2+ and Co2+ transporter CorA
MTTRLNIFIIFKEEKTMSTPRFLPDNQDNQKLNDINKKLTEAGEELSRMLKVLEELVPSATTVIHENKQDVLLSALRNINGKLLPKKPADTLKKIKSILDSAKPELNQIRDEINLAGDKILPSYKEGCQIALENFEVLTKSMKVSTETYQKLMLLTKAITDKAKMLASAAANTPVNPAPAAMKVGT